MAKARSQLARQRSSPHGVVVGSVGGFQISLDYSWFVIFFLIFGTFTSAVFPAYIPGLSQQSYLLMGIVGTVLFFASLLAHELAHVARALGIPVEGITLFIFGGMARTRTEAARPREEFLIAVVGPVASLALRVACYALARLADQAFRSTAADCCGRCCGGSPGACARPRASLRSRARDWNG